MNGVQLARVGLPLTYGEIAAALVRMYGEKRAHKTVEILRARDGMLNVLDQCGDLARVSCKIDGGLVAVDHGEVATRD